MGQRRLDEEDGADRPEDGHREALEGPGQRDVQVAGRGGRGAGLPGPRGGRVPLPVPGRHVRQVQEGRPGAVHSGRHRHRRRLRRGAPHARRRGHRHRAHAGWLGFLRGLREHGLSGVRLVVSDAHAGLVRAIAECLPGAGWQRCVVHLGRDVCSLLASRRHRAMAGKTLQAVFRETDPATVRSARAGALLEERRGRRPHLPGLPRGAPEAHTHQQRAGAHEQGDKVQVAGGPGLPERRVRAAPGGRRARRVGRGLVKPEVHLARVHAEALGARRARARGERGVAQEGSDGRRDRDGARRRRKGGRVMP